MSTVGLPLTARTVAETIFAAAQRDPARVAFRHKAGGQWLEVTTEAAAGTVRALAGGLLAAGIRPGDRVALLADTRVEWTYANLAIIATGAVAVPIYPTSSVEDCTWVLTDSGATMVICDTERQHDKLVTAGATNIVTIEPFASSPRTLADLGQSTVDESELAARLDAITPDDLAVIIYTSGTTGPPKGCKLTHQNWLALLDINDKLSYVTGDDVVYLFLPLAHVFAQLEQFACLGCGATLVYFGGDVKQVIPELSEVRPTFLPSVPRVFEKLYTAITGQLDPDTLRTAVAVGLEYRRLSGAGEPVPVELATAFERLEPLYAKVRAAFGGRVRQCLSGAAPIAAEVLEFFFAAGVPVLEGYGMTETTGLGTVSTLANHKLGSVGRAAPGVEVMIDADGEILARGPHLFAGYWRNDAATAEIIDADGWLHTGDLGTMDEAGYVTITGRKKDIIITAGGKNIAPANFENELRQSRWISYAIMFGDRRPYPVALITLDPDEIAAANPPDIHAVIQEVIDRVNAKHSTAEQIKRFAILDRDLTIEAGELTPSMKVKRNVVLSNHAALIETLYG